LMDVSMPVMDGRVATRAIRASQGPSALAPIVALTANTMAEEREAFLSDGMNEVLAKPILRQDLLNVINHYAERDDIELPQDQGRGASLVVELQYMKDMRELLDTTVCQSLLNSFGAEVDKALGYITNEDPIGEISSHAHKVAGSAAIFGAIYLRDVLYEVENAARQQDIDGVAEAVAILPEVWAKTLPLLVVAAGKN
jgi:response regulator RpfG family c-di-GMP phosphodiesterase